VITTRLPCITAPPFDLTPPPAGGTPLLAGEGEVHTTIGAELTAGCHSSFALATDAG
jgi:hypothetical protein